MRVVEALCGVLVFGAGACGSRVVAPAAEVLAPRPTISAVDSVRAVGIATGILGPWPAGVRVVTFHVDRDGVLIRLGHAESGMLGGGGLVWIDRSGEHWVVLARYQ